jgi:hypothetical protein
MTPGFRLDKGEHLLNEVAADKSLGPNQFAYNVMHDGSLQPGRETSWSGIADLS